MADSIWQTPSQKPEGNMNKEEQRNKVGRLQRPLGLWQSQKEMKIKMQTGIQLCENFKDKDVLENKMHYTGTTAIQNEISGMNNGV